MNKPTVAEISLSDIQRILALRLPKASRFSVLGESAEVLIYGAGNCGGEVARLLRDEGVTVTGFLDSNVAPGAIIAGLPVWHPAASDLTPERRGGCCVVIAIFNPAVDIVALLGNLEEWGYRRVVTFLELFRYFPRQLGDRFWLTETSFYDGREPEIVAAGNLLSDWESRELFLALLKFRMTGDYRLLPAPSPEKQYFDCGLPRWPEPVSFIDCGSYSGDTLCDLHSCYDRLDTIVAFEPDADSFQQLSTRLRQNPSLRGNRAFLYPCGVWSETTKLSFAADVGTSSAVSSQGSCEVQCMALDDALPGFRPTLIKMDIEGAELHALKGARQMIEAHLPGLAISAYHAPEHLWEIVLLLESWSLGYRFYLRCYCQAGFDTVLYGFPPEASLCL